MAAALTLGTGKLPQPSRANPTSDQPARRYGRGVRCFRIRVKTAAARIALRDTSAAVRIEAPFSTLIGQ